MAINQYLFDILKLVDPSTDVVSDGESGTYSTAPQNAGYTGRRAYPTVDTWGECYRLNCPFCGDRKKRLFFSHLCGIKAKVPKRVTPVQFSSFVCICHNEHCNSQHHAFKKWLLSLGIDKGPVVDLSTAFSPRKLDGYSIFASEEDTLPTPCYPLTAPEVPQACLDYLDRRGFDPYTLQADYGCGYSPDGAEFSRMSDDEYRKGLESLGSTGQSTASFKKTDRLWGNRIIIPVTQGRRLIGWQGRTIVDNDVRCPKYYTSPRLNTSRTLFNMDSAILGNIAVLVEGVFDVFRIGSPAMCMFGKSLSEFQMAILKLAFSQTGGCLVMLDPEVPDETYKLAERIYNAGIFPRGVVPAYLTHPGPDPAECSAGDIRDIIEHYSRQLSPSVPAEAPRYTAKEMLEGFEELDAEDSE